MNKEFELRRVTRTRLGTLLPDFEDLTIRHKILKGLPVWLACAGLALPALGWAEAPPPNAHVLGVAESALNYCGPLDPAAAARMRTIIEQLLQGVSQQQLSEVRESDEYRKAYDSVTDFVGKVDEHNAKRICAESVADSR
jgi:hypothetical protein